MPASPGDKYTVMSEHTSAPTPPSTIMTVSVGATKRVWLTELNVGSKSATALAGARLSLNRAADAGTGGTATTPTKVDPLAPNAIFTAKNLASVWTVEPGTLAPFYSIGLNAVASEIWTPPEPIQLNVSTFFVIRIEVDSSTTKVQWAVTATFQE